MNYRLNKDSSFYDFTAEEQATIVGDYYEMTQIYQSDPKPPDWVKLRSPDLPIYEKLIAQLRTARPRTETMIYQQSLMNQPEPTPWLDDSKPAWERPAQVMPLLQIKFKGP